MQGKSSRTEDMESIFLLASHDKVLETSLVARSLKDMKQSGGWCFAELMSDLGNLEAALETRPSSPPWPQIPK